MMDIIVPILGAFALSFVVAGTLCLVGDARAAHRPTEMKRLRDDGSRAELEPRAPPRTQPDPPVPGP